MNSGDKEEYINSLPRWHKHRGGHLVKVERYENERFYGHFWNVGATTKYQIDLTDREHFSCLERKELREPDNAEVAKHILLLGE